MKLIIAGSRHFKEVDFSFIEKCTELFEINNKIDEITSGGAEGIDKSGEMFAEIYGYPITRFIPRWDLHGKSAGPIRNRLMADNSDSLLLIWDGKSKGSSSMKNEMLRAKKPVYEIIVRCNK